MVAVVQLVERQIVILVVVGSSPIGHPIFIPHLGLFIELTCPKFTNNARVAELVDALVLGTSII